MNIIDFTVYYASSCRGICFVDEIFYNTIRHRYGTIKEFSTSEYSVSLNTDINKQASIIVRHKNKSANEIHRRKYELYEDACMVFNNLSAKYNEEEFKQSISLMKEHLDEVSTPVQLKKYL